MKAFSTGLWLLCLLTLTLDAGVASPPPGPVSPGASWIEWDRASDRVVSAPGDAGAAYPRAKQLSNGEILLAYHHGEGLGDFGSAVTLRKSRDGGATWYQTQQIEGPNEKGFWGFCNPDFIELGGGRLMLVTAARGRSDLFARDVFTSECKRSGLRARFSNDYGATWGPPRMILGGRGRLWEPSIVRLPNGELEIFYANESPDLQVEGSTQCIEAIRSVNDGKTWSPPSVISEDGHCRNGMPAALALGNGNVACAQEVVGSSTSPWIADTLHGRRTGKYQLAQDQYDFGAAPFLAAAADGGTLLAYHSQVLQPSGFKRLPMSWMFSHVCVQHGDALAGSFGPASCPWPDLEERTGTFFPSLIVLNGGKLVALASFITVDAEGNARTVVRWIKGQMDGAPNRALLGRNEAFPRSPELLVPRPPAAISVTRAASLPIAEAEYRYSPPPSEDLADAVEPEN